MIIDRGPRFPFHDILSLFAEKTNETLFTQAQKQELLQHNFVIVKMDDTPAKDILRILLEQHRLSGIRIPEDIGDKIENKHTSFRWVAVSKDLLSRERSDGYHQPTKTIREWAHEFDTNKFEYTNGISGVRPIVPNYAMALSLLKQNLYSYVHQQFIVENGWSKPEWSLTTHEGISLTPQIHDTHYEESKERHFWFRWDISYGQNDVKHRSVLPVIVPAS